MYMKFSLTITLLLSLMLTTESYAKIKIYLSADRTGAKESGISIEQGIKTALFEMKNKLANQDVEVIILNHRGSTPRFKKHLKKFLNDNEALVMYSGLHSPPLLSQKKFISENEIVMLDPWAAAGPITRYNSKDNYIFRLSIDDSKAGKVIAKNAIINEKFKKPYLLLENTGWGKSNKKTMTKALDSLKVGVPYLKFFNWNISKTEAKIVLKNIIQSGSDVIFLVANAKEGKVFAKAMSELPKKERVPIRSHWGITGGDFPTVINKNIRDHIDLQFIQTSFSFMDKDLSKKGKNVFNKLKKLYPSIKTYKDLKAPVGFIHSYDLTHILRTALSQIVLTNDIKENRRLLKNSLENIKKPVNGLIKTYNKPFSTFSKKNIDAHEALNENDFIMAEYGESNEILLKK